MECSPCWKVLLFGGNSGAGKTVISRWLAKRFGVGLAEVDVWGPGYGTEAVRLLTDYRFQEAGLAEVRTGTWTGNVRMMRAAQECGFAEIGRHPHEARSTVRGSRW